MRRITAILILILSFVDGRAQGIYTNFGQNTTGNKKIAYSLTNENIEIMYYPGGEVLAKLTLDNVIKLLPEYEVRLNYNLSNGIKITVFNNYEDYRNSNINITNPQLYAGGYSTLNDNSGGIYF
ncbi:MAG TPA: hypothetical protein VGF79_06300, partial [Bacteroidia bacterium]